MENKEKDTKKRCMDCEHCTWLNGWRCSLGCWEFDIWTGKCDEFKADKYKPEI